jgi:hypothetical protein
MFIWNPKNDIKLSMYNLNPSNNLESECYIKSQVKRYTKIHQTNVSKILLSNE